MFLWTLVDSGMTSCSLKTIEVLGIPVGEWVEATSGALVVFGPKICPTGNIKLGVS